ncbi:hypothetical protein GCM10023196_049350 [Actinoallomurus vinaceus]|uniref:Uncharacterized protein n=1 Tax=Actinoallomurus vinaceus TaxID=1080074 RepID=A0ABP8UEG5_9ACTN
MSSDPFIVDWHEPLLYQYRASARVERPAEQYDATLVTRAASLLTSAGWQVTDEVTDARSDTELITVIAGRMPQQWRRPARNRTPGGGRSHRRERSIFTRSSWPMASQAGRTTRSSADGLTATR